jgi:hypothetical protein
MFLEQNESASARAEDAEEHRAIIGPLILDSIPPEWLKGDLYGLRFVDEITQEALVYYVPNYQNW